MDNPKYRVKRSRVPPEEFWTLMPLPEYVPHAHVASVEEYRSAMRSRDVRLAANLGYQKEWIDTLLLMMYPMGTLRH